MPWSLKGISDEAREFAKLSADNSDVPVGAWLSQVIRTASGAVSTPLEKMIESSPPQNATALPVTSPSTAVPSPAIPARGGSAGGSTIERAAQIVDDFGFEPEGPARDADLIEDPAILQAELLALERRLENAESNTQDNLAPLIAEIDRIKARLDDSGSA